MPRYASFAYVSVAVVVAAPVAVFPDLARPELHPRFGSTPTTPATWATFGNATRFATLRGFTQTPNLTIVDYEASLRQYAPLGDVIWPVWATIFAPNFDEVARYLAANGFYLTDLWGFVPGSGGGDEMWQAFTPPPQALADATAILGDRWLGMDVGEQDGRYIGEYADQHEPLGAPPEVQRQYFEAHFQAMYSQLGGRVVGLQSLTFAHAMAQSGAFTIIGCESAQALVNAQLFYAVARGAAKQYGLLIFGNVSVYNRFGYKTFPGAAGHGTRTDGVPWMHASGRRGGADGGDGGRYGGSTGSGGARGVAGRSQRRLGEGAAAAAATATGGAPRAAPPGPLACTNQGQGGPTCGTSLSLMTKLMYAQVFYNPAYVSFESSWFGAGGALTPVGQLQADARAFVAAHGAALGVHAATIGLLLDAAAGFTAPRHLYSGDTFRVWGNLPYSSARGDYLADALLRLAYPGYADSSYFHDETGFSAPTPFGDAVDVLLSDAPAWLLARYDTLLLAGTPRTEPGLLRRKLCAALAAGARVVAFAGALGAWGDGGLGGCAVAEAAYAGDWAARCAAFPRGTVVELAPAAGGGNVTEPAAFAACAVVCGGGAAAAPVAWALDGAGGRTAVAWAVAPPAGGGGSLLLFGAPFGAPAAAAPAPDPGVDAPLGTHFPLLAHVAAALTADLAGRALVTASPGLTVTVCRAPTPREQQPAAYTVLVSNPRLTEAPFALAAPVGAIVSATELGPLASPGVRAAPGWLPDGYAGTPLGNSTATTIAGADTRAFRLLVDEAPGAVRLVDTARPPPRPRRVALHLRGGALPGAVAALPGLLAAVPSLPQAFDTLLVPYGYLADREAAVLVAEAAALRRGGLDGAVDFTGGLDLFPTLRLVNNSAPEFAASLRVLTSVLAKAGAMGWRHAVLALHRTPENNEGEAAALASMAATLASLAQAAGAANVTLHLRNARKTPGSVRGLPALGTWLRSAGIAGRVRLFPNVGDAVADGDGAAAVAGALAAGPGALALVGASCAARDAAGTVYSASAPLAGGPACAPADRAAAAALLAAACAAGACVTGGGGGGLDVLLVVDAYVGPGALLGEPSASGAALGAGGGPGAALDAAYEEAQWLLDAVAAAAAASAAVPLAGLM